LVSVWAWMKLALAGTLGLQYKTLVLDKKGLLYARGEEYLQL
jgi:hypothetical protein